MEEFALSAVKETLADPYVMSRIEEHLSGLFGTEPSRREQERAVAKESLELTERKIRKLLQIVEDGHEGGGSVRQRLAELESQKEELQRQIQYCGADMSPERF